MSKIHEGMVYTSLDRDVLSEMLTRMLRIRLFDECASSIKAASIPGFLHNSIGQEAEIVGACMALRQDDYMTGNHRSHGHPIGKGALLPSLMAELLGKGTGVCGGKGGSMHLAVFGVGSLGESGIVGASMPTAVGAALSAQLRGTDQVCLSFFGDGASNSGPFHESLNLAAIWSLPVIFLCENNGYAACSSQARTTAIKDIAVRATSYGMPGAIVDGQDVLAVYETVLAAAARARSGLGPTLVEAKTYRYCDHLESDFQLPSYRIPGELDIWRAKDPIEVFSRLLAADVRFSREEVDDIKRKVQSEVAEALSFARASAPPAASELLEDVFI